MLGTGLESNKISAIGIPADDEYTRKDSPFWDADNIFELQSAGLYNQSEFSSNKKISMRRQK